MDIEKVEVFVKGSGRFFEETTNTKAKIGTPFLLDSTFTFDGDYTGTIGITGEHKGCLCLTLKRPMLAELLKDIGEETVQEGLMADLVGELANIMSGNARENFGSGFMISVPLIIKGSLSQIQLPGNVVTFLIPVVWKNHTAYLSISLDRWTK